MKAEDILKELVMIPAISGFELKFGMKEKIFSFFSFFEKSVDNIGNIVINVKKGKLRILIEAHIDEVGFLRVGKTLVKIGKPSSINNIEELEGIAFFKRRFISRNNLVYAPALDNRSGCTVLVLLSEILKNKKYDADIYLAFTVREETTKEGIQNVVKNLRPDIIISIDSAFADIKKEGWRTTKCGMGPAIQPVGKSFIITDYLRIEKVAKKRNIPFQYELLDSESGCTNLSAIKGIRAYQINIPVKDQHKPISSLNVSDINETARLIDALIEDLIN